MQKVAACGLRVFYPDFNAVVHSIPERSYDQGLMKHIKRMTKIRDAACADYRVNDERPGWFRDQYSFPVRYVYRVSDCRVILPSGGVACSGLWLQESFGHYLNVLLFVSKWRAGALLSGRIFRRTQKRESPCTFVCGTGYYHFLLEALPRLLHVLSQAPDVCVLARSETKAPFVAQYLDLLRSQGRVKSLEMIQGDSLQCADYLFTALEPKSGFVHRDDVDVLRAVFLPLKKNGAETARYGRRIFIGRRHASRAFANQDEIGKSLSSMGFSVVDLEDLGVLEQMALFNQAEVIVSNHGAGLANLVWCDQCEKVVELFSPKYLNDCYFRLARTCGIEYGCVMAEGAGSTWGAIDLGVLRKSIG